MKRLILASGSPRRKELLEQVNLTFDIRISSCEEVITKTIPWEIVMELSRLKAEDIGRQLSEEEKEDCCVIGADTIVSIDNRILGKPGTREEAIQMLTDLSDSVHQVYTGVTLICYKNGVCIQKSFYEKTDVYFYPLSGKKIEEYVDFGDPMSNMRVYTEDIPKMIRAGWMDETGNWRTNNGYPPVCFDKAGAYGIQGAATAFVRKIDGDYNNVVGLPVARLLLEMEKLS